MDISVDELAQSMNPLEIGGCGCGCDCVFAKFLWGWGVVREARVGIEGWSKEVQGGWAEVRSWSFVAGCLGVKRAEKSLLFLSCFYILQVGLSARSEISSPLALRLISDTLVKTDTVATFFLQIALRPCLGNAPERAQKPVANTR